MNLKEERSYIFIDEDGHITNIDSFISLTNFVLESIEGHRLVMLEIIKMIEELRKEIDTITIKGLYNKN